MCPTPEQWYDYKEGLLSDSDQNIMRNHIEQCPACSNYLDTLHTAAALLDKTAPTADRHADIPAPATACPDAEILTDILTGSLPEAERTDIYAHLNECARCRRDLMTLQHLIEAADAKDIAIPAPEVRRKYFDQALEALVPPSDRPIPPRAARSGWIPFLQRWALIPVAAMAILLAFVWVRSVREERQRVSQEAHQLVEKGMQDLRASFGSIRPTDLRISGNFVGSSFRVRGAMKSTERDSLSNAETLLLRAWNLRPHDLKTNLALSRYYLTQKNKLDEAEKYLKAALRLAPQSAEVHNDLGVLAYERKNYGEAAGEFNQAMTCDPHYAEPVYNAALLHIRQWQDAVASSNAAGAAQHAVEAKALVARYRTLESNFDWLNDLERELRRMAR